jgi:hypothetical protein
MAARLQGSAGGRKINADAVNGVCPHLSGLSAETHPSSTLARYASSIRRATTYN